MLKLPNNISVVNVIPVHCISFYFGQPVISHFPKKRGCPKNRFHNGAMLLLFISKQAEPAFLSKITIGQSQQPIKGKVFRDLELGTLTLHSWPSVH